MVAIVSDNGVGLFNANVHTTHDGLGQPGCGAFINKLNGNGAFQSANNTFSFTGTALQDVLVASLQARAYTRLHHKLIPISMRA